MCQCTVTFAGYKRKEHNKVIIKIINDFVFVGAYKVAGVEDAFNYSCTKSGTVQAALILWYGNELVDQCILFYEVVSPVIVIGMFQFIRFLTKQTLYNKRKRITVMYCYII